MDFKKVMAKDYSAITWDLYIYEHERLIKKDITKFFELWKGTKGRATFRKIGWNDTHTRNIYSQMNETKAQSMFLNELFFMGYLKQTMKKPVADAYDVDGFVVSLSQKHILPVEMKEKYPVLTERERFFGIDAGRIMMLLRLCIPNDSNAIYIVRQINNKEERKFEAWKYITLSQIIMSAGWNFRRVVLEWVDRIHRQSSCRMMNFMISMMAYLTKKILRKYPIYQRK